MHGLTLIELLVALAIGLILTLAIVGVLNRGEGLKRTTTTLNDVNQSANTVAYLMDRTLRSAGSGYAQRWREIFGCRLIASRDGGQMLPRATNFPAPFTNVRGALGTAGVMRVAPLLIGKGLAPGAGGDVLIVMTGTGGIGETPVRVNTGSATTGSVLLPSTLGFRANDLVLISDAALGHCMLQQVSNAFAPANPPGQLLPFANRYADDAIDNVALSSLGATGQAYAALIGNAATNFPLFQMFAVGDNATLFSYDLLRFANADVEVPVSEGVVAMHALYGVTNAGNAAGTVDVWIDPGDDAANWGLAALTNGTAEARARLRRIVSVRVGLVLRAALPEREAGQAVNVAPATLTLFSDLGNALQQTVDVADQSMRHRAVEFTVPLRNLMLQDMP